MTVRQIVYTAWIAAAAAFVMAVVLIALAVTHG